MFHPVSNDESSNYVNLDSTSTNHPLHHNKDHSCLNNARSSSLDFELYSTSSSYSSAANRKHFASNKNQINSSVDDHDDDDDSILPSNGIQWFMFQSRGAISFRLRTNKPILIGSGSECDIRLLHHYHQQNPTSSTAAPVEKRHAVLAFEPNSNSFTVRDLNTTNGTYVNNRRLFGDHPETVSDLDVLRFGYDIHFIHDNKAKANATLSKPGAGEGEPSSLPQSLNNTFRSKSQEDYHHRTPLFSRSSSSIERGLPPRGTAAYGGGAGANGVTSAPVVIKRSGGSPFLPRKTLLTKKNSDPGAGENRGDCSGGLYSDRLERRNSFGSGIASAASKSSIPPITSLASASECGVEKPCNNLRQNTPSSNVMQQGGRSGTSGVCSPSLTLDSGRGSSSAPSSPAKEMSPVQMTTTGSNAAVCPTTTATGGGASSSSSQGHNGSPIFARKLPRPMEYLLGQNNGSSNEPSDSEAFCVDPDCGAELTSGNYMSFCSGSEPMSFGTTGSSTTRGTGNANNVHNAPRNNLNCTFPTVGSDCEILQIKEDFDDNNDEIGERKDSLEEEEDAEGVQVFTGRDKKNDNTAAQQQAVVQPQFLVGGDMQPDLNVPNEVFGPISHAEILNRNATGLPCKNLNNNSAKICTIQEGDNKSALVEGYPHHYTPRARSSSGDLGNGGGGGGSAGGSNRSTPLSALYGTPHWWPDSPPEDEETYCPPPPASSTNASPFRKPFLLNNNINNRLKGNSFRASSEPVKDLSLESVNSQRSGNQQNITPCSPVRRQSFSSLEDSSASKVELPDTMATVEVKKLTPMAFTIDFSDGNETLSGSGGVTSEAAEAKKAAIAERLSKFSARHRRNASLTKSDDVVGTAEPFTASSASLPKQTKSSSGSSGGSNSLGRTSQPHQHQQRNQTACVGESSSLSKSTSLPKKMSSSGSASATVSKHPSGGSNYDSGLRSLSPDTISSTTSSSSRSRPLGDTKTVIKNNLATGDTTTSAMGRKPNASANKQGTNVRGGTPVSGAKSKPGHGLRTKAEIVNETKLNDLSKCSPPHVPTVVSPPAVVDKEDTVSEAGTYTVEKETPDVVSARESIEHVFGLNGDETDKENNVETVISSSDANKSFVVGSAEPGTRDWVREWAELAAQQHQQKKQQRQELPDSQYFLRETESLVSAIQERVSKHMKSSGEGVVNNSLRAAGPGSDSDEDEPTLSHHTPVKSQSQQSTPTHTNKRRPPSRTSPFHRESSVLSDSGYAIGYESDNSNEGSASTSTTHQQTRERGSADPSSLSHPHGSLSNKMNRAFIIRRGGRSFGFESTSSSTEPLLLMNNQQSMVNLPLGNLRGISPKPVQVNSLSKCANANLKSSSSSPHFARNDGGRFSLRMPKSKTPPAQMPPPGPRQSSYSGGSGDAHGRLVLNGHQPQSREHSVASSGGGSNGRKYTANGRFNGGGGPPKKGNGNRSNSTLTAKEVELANWKRRKNYDPMKAAAEGKNKKKPSGAESGMEENTVPLPTVSSPKLVNRREAMLTKSLSFHQESYSPKCASEEEDMIYIVDEMDSSNSNSLNHLGGGGGGVVTMARSYHEDVMYCGMTGSASAMKPKNKLEALDNLVIATIHSLSNKVRTSSRHLLEKLQSQHSNDENGALLEEMVSQLKELEGPASNSSPNKSPSRELSGTLKNLKKLEQVILVLDKVLGDGFDSDVNG